MDAAPRSSEIDFSRYRMRVPTDRYSSREFHERERQSLWMRVWQVAGRADELPEAGDWLEYRILDQSYVLVRGKDRVIRGFVNACRHRGNAFCRGKGHSAQFTCPYHNWSYRLDGQLLGVPKPHFEGTVEEFVGSREKLGLVQIPVDCFAGFIFLNPDRSAAPLAGFLGEAAELLAPYHLEEMVPVGLNVREAIACNWKVVVDAFEEGYHVQGVHPELIPTVDLARERCCFFGFHGATTVPFGAPGLVDATPEQEVATIQALPMANFPGLAEVMPRFDEQVASCRDKDGTLRLPPGVTARTLLQRAVRETMTGQGLDVGGLTDNQMSDYQFWLLFPNVYMQVRAGEATVIKVQPDPGGDPNRCFWQVMNLQWFPPEEREAKREQLLDVAEGEHFPYFLALEQDYQQMEIQQHGLRNGALEYMSLTKLEPKVAHFHTTLDAWLQSVPPE